MKTLISRLIQIERSLVVFFFSVMVLASVFQVVNRNLLHIPVGWSEELARYCMVWMALLGTQISLRRGTQMSIEVFVKRLKGKASVIITLLSDTLVCTFNFVVFGYSLSLIMLQLKNGQLSAAMKIPMVLPYSAMALCFLIMGVSHLVKVVDLFRNLPAEREDTPHD